MFLAYERLPDDPPLTLNESLTIAIVLVVATLCYLLP